MIHRVYPSSPLLTRLSLIILGLTLWLTQWAFGGLHAWVYAKTALVLGMVASTLLLFLATKSALHLWDASHYPPPQVNLPPLSLHATIFILLALGQIVPLPNAVVSVLNPGSTAQFVSPLSLPQTWTISLNAHASIIEMLKWLPLALTYFMTIYAVRNQSQVMSFILFMALLGIFQIGYGMSQTYSGSEKIWYFSKIQYRTFITGTYISRNQLAYYLESVVLTVMGTSLGMLYNLKRNYGKIYNEQFWKILFLVFLSIILTIGLLLSASRGGIISLGIGLCCLALMLSIRSTMRWACLGIFFMATLTILYIPNDGLERTASRFKKESDLQQRFDLATSVVPMVHTYPLTGVGIGMFNTAYDPYALRPYGGSRKASHAHNDWVEIAAETGIPGLIICTSGYLLFLGHCLRLWSRRHHPVAVGIGAGIISALVSLGIHSFFDFGMRVPANVLAVGILCGLLWSILHLHDNHRLQRKQPYTLRHGVCVAILLSASILLVGMIAFTLTALRHDQTERLCPVQRTIYPSSRPSLDRILAARRLAPDVPEYMVEQALRQADLVSTGRAGPGLILHSASLLRQALNKDPANGLYWRKYAALLAYCTQYSFGYSLIKETNQAYQRARILRPYDSSITLSEACYRLEQGLGETGIELLTATVRLSPYRWKDAVDTAFLYTQESHQLLKIVESVKSIRPRKYIIEILQTHQIDQK